MSDSVARLNAALEGRYRIERELGEGGMATVYLADDLKHERKVALKVLKPELAAVVGADRFLAEIKTTANLQHPHILPLFDSGEAGSFLFYVMPYVEGETLRHRLDREQQLPVNEAVRIATNVAEALGYAHSHGVIHRDIKPANILLQSGKPVISDFGIALAVRAGGGDRLTETGLSVGTPHYMSPEQATGDQTVGPASDVYALGCVLYEMLVGEPPYTGSNAQAILGKIIQGQASRVTDIRKSTPGNVASAVARSLEKLPADRFATADDFAHALEDPAFRWAEPAGAAGHSGAGGFWKPLAVGLAIVAVALVGGLVLAISRPEPTQPVQRFPQPFARGEAPVYFDPGAFDLSPDGSMVVYVGPYEEGDQQFWVRRWDDIESTPIPSSSTHCCPEVSPDGQEVVLRNSRQRALVILPMDGGPSRTLGEGTNPVWGDDGFIYFQRDDALYRVPAAGGDAELLLATPPPSIIRPQALLPGEDALVAIAIGLNGRADVRVIELSTREWTVLFDGEVTDVVRYLPTGHLLYLTDGVLMAAPFDAAARELRGPLVPLISGVQAFSVSDDGKLMYTTGAEGGSNQTELVWLSRAGEVEAVEPGWTFDAGFGNPGWSLSPDGTRIALRIDTDGNRDIWVKELLRGTLQRITSNPGVDWVPIWTADGQQVIYLSGDTTDVELWQTNADGTGAPELLFTVPGISQEAVSPDGTQFILRRGAFNQRGGRDLLTFRPGVDSALVPLIATAEFDEQDPAVSPDGQWLAYTSNETGRNEVYVVSFPDVEAQKTPVSTRGGFGPVWGRSRQELYYIDGSRSVVAASYRTQPRFQITADSVLFAIPERIPNQAGTNRFSAAPDDERFLMGRNVTAGGDGVASATEDPEYVLVLNFFEEVKRRVPTP